MLALQNIGAILPQFSQDAQEPLPTRRRTYMGDVNSQTLDLLLPESAFVQREQTRRGTRLTERLKNIEELALRSAGGQRSSQKTKLQRGKVAHRSALFNDSNRGDAAAFTSSFSHGATDINGALDPNAPSSAFVFLPETLRSSISISEDAGRCSAKRRKSPNSRSVSDS